MKKKILWTIVLLLLLLIGLAAWRLLGPTVSTASGEFFYIQTGASYADVKEQLISKKYVPRAGFDLAARLLHYKTVKPGRYKITNGMSLFSLLKRLRNGNQTPVSFVITKLRTREDLARKAGAIFECDSSELIHFLSNNDSLEKYGLDSNTAMAAVMPYTYTINWNISAGKLFQKLYASYKSFWTEERKQKAQQIGLSPVQVSTLASIVEEETLKTEDKPNIASVYLNRLSKGMPLQADPTIKFSLKDFGLKRILDAHLKVISPYNTYIHTGLPPGPICTPSVETINAVLDAPKTEYLYFVASSNFDGTSVFTTNISDHSKYAREYQRALNQRMDSRKKMNLK